MAEIKLSRSDNELLLAAEKGDLEGVKRALLGGFLRKPANVNAQNVLKETSLFLAAKFNYPNIVEYLVKVYNANPCIGDMLGKLPAHGCIMSNDSKNLRMLCAYMNYESVQNPEKLLMLAAEVGSTETIDILLDWGVPINAHHERYGNNAATFAIISGDVKKLEYLAEKGINLHHVDFDDNTLYMDIQNLPSKENRQKRIDVVKFLWEKGVDINRPNKDGITPLMKAVELNDVNLVRFMLEHGAKPNEKDKDGNTALMKTMQWPVCEPMIMRLLIEHGADVHLKNNKMQNALMIAEESLEKMQNTPSEHFCTSEAEKECKIKCRVKVDVLKRYKEPVAEKIKSSSKPKVVAKGTQKKTRSTRAKTRSSGHSDGR